MAIVGYTSWPSGKPAKHSRPLGTNNANGEGTWVRILGAYEEGNSSHDIGDGNMAHEIEVDGEGKGSFAYSGKIGSAWHRLGVELPGLSKADDILAACRGDYEVHKTELLTPDPGKGQGNIPTGRYYTWRETKDVDEDGTEGPAYRQVLGVVGSDYRVIQNRQALDLALSMASMSPDKPNIDCAGVLNEGQRFFATIPLPELVIDPNGIADRYGRNMVVVTGHDGTNSLEVVNGFTRAVCANTVAAALSGTQFKIKIRHVGSDDIPVAVAKKQLGMLLSANEEFEAIAYSLLGKKSSWKEVERIAQKLWPVKPDASDQAKTINENRVVKLQTIWDSKRGAAGVGENRYAALQTFTEYMEHEQHIVGKSNRYNRSLRAVDSGGFNLRVNRLTKALQQAYPVKAL